VRIITEPKDLIGRYVAMKIGRPAAWGPFAAFGLVNGDDELVAGAVFNGYIKPSITLSIAAERLTPAFMATIMGYAFRQCDCARITGAVEKKNRASRAFALHLGAKLEGCMRKASERGDVMIYGLLREDAGKWLGERYLNKLEASWVS